MPWAIRAANSHPTLEAKMNINMLAIWITSAARTTGRRPSESDNDPVNRSAMRSAIAYTAKTSVSSIAEKCQLAA